MWGWLEALCTPPKLLSCSWSSRLPTLHSRTGCTPHCRPEQLPQPDCLLPGEGTFLGRTHSQRAVSEGTRLGSNQGHCIHSLFSNFETKQAASLQNAKPQPPLWGTQTADPELLQSCTPTPTSTPAPPPPVLSQRCLNVRSWADKPGSSYGLGSAREPLVAWLPTWRTTPSTVLGWGGLPQLHDPLKLHTQTCLPARLLSSCGLIPFLYPLGICLSFPHPHPLVVFISDLHWGQHRDLPVHA